MQRARAKKPAPRATGRLLASSRLSRPAGRRGGPHPLPRAVRVSRHQFSYTALDPDLSECANALGAIWFARRRSMGLRPSVDARTGPQLARGLLRLRQRIHAQTGPQQRLELGVLGQRRPAIAELDEALDHREPGRLAILVDLYRAPEARKRLLVVASLGALGTEVEQALLDPIPRARLELVGPAGVEPLEERARRQLGRALQRLPASAWIARRSSLLEGMIEVPGVAGERVGRVQPVDVPLAQDRLRLRAREDAPDIGERRVEVAPSRRRLTARPEVLEQVVAARSPRMQAEVDEDVERPLRAPCRGRHQASVHVEAGRAEQRQARGTRLSE